MSFALPARDPAKLRPPKIPALVILSARGATKARGLRNYAPSRGAGTSRNRRKNILTGSAPESLPLAAGTARGKHRK